MIGVAAVWFTDRSKPLELPSYVAEEVSQPNVARFKIVPFMPIQRFLNGRKGNGRSQYLDGKGSLEHPGKTALDRDNHRGTWQYKGQ